jgi:hypothetical protein
MGALRQDGLADETVGRNIKKKLIVCEERTSAREAEESPLLKPLPGND